MTTRTVAVTGGNGRIGEAILSELADHGYRTVNLARGKRREDVSDEYRTTDLLDAGEVYGSLAASDADAVVHMGTIPAPVSHPGHVTYESNVMTSYHLLEAAGALGIDDVCLASSINAMGSVFQDPPMEVEYLPVDEKHPVTPRDPYAVGKHALEVTADGFGRREDGPDSISTLRYPWVPTEDELREHYAGTDRRLGEIPREETERNNLFTYLHIRDAAAVARRAVEADLDGHERFWAVAADTCVADDTEAVVEKYFADADRRATFDGCESLVTSSKAADLLGWEPTRSWRDL